MRALSRTDMAHDGWPDLDSETGDLPPQLRLALVISTCARLLLNDPTENDQTASVLTYI